MNDNTPLVSIIIPCYNVEFFVEKAIESILSQTYCNLEIFVIDDASTDNTLEKVSAFTDARIKIKAFKNNTQKIGAVNEVLKQVKGQLIAFQDADDWSEPRRIEKQVNEFLKNTSLGICFTNYRYTGSKEYLPGKISLTDEDLKNEFLNYKSKIEPGKSPTICGTMMISQEALLKTGGYHPYFIGRVAEDIQWLYRILKHFTGITIDEVLYSYTIRKGSFTQIQKSGLNPKYAYSWQLLSKIIYRDIHEGIDVLSPENKEILSRLELQACEDALMENIQLLNDTRMIYENSISFRIGKLIISPWKLIRRILD